MINQLRLYQLFPATAAAFHARFRDHAARIMRGHGFRILAMWETGEGDSLAFAYLLAWADEAEMAAGWAAFMADADWARIKRETLETPIVGRIEDRVLRPTEYSAALGDIA
ncbi:NIPSNAP family containing protein [Paroceanicella profunda]|uniref:NIPSNAP family containing protein n=1 Tax=Paroceanicella profunda TaxID=2579971 RepID=A0A5B8FYV9_9RHOB|nr:NIPSNAP family protein [Paroceanicella profunda]QDL91869.1 NIPSNAP family containing protein [Paroceanicella profunda]